MIVNKSNSDINTNTTLTSRDGDNHPISTESSAHSASNRSTNVSPQTQLQTIAKQFAIDGALIPIGKQPLLEERAHRRERLEQLRNQKNLESIIKRANAYCSGTDIAERVDQDWFNNYLSLAQGISNKTMQDLWSKILAKEITHAGSFSHKTLKVFRTMSIHEAKLFAKVCSIAVKDNSKKNIRVISGAYYKPGLLNLFNKKRRQIINLSEFSLNYTELLTLAENNLIFIQETESSPLVKNEELHFNYNGSPLNLSAKKANCILSFYKLSPVGTELANLISDNVDEKYFQALKKQLSYHFNIHD